MDDEYGYDLDDGWEDPQHMHDYCTGCSVCIPWEGKSYDQIRAERRAYVAAHRG